MSVLELNHVKKSFNNGTLHVLKDISLPVDVPPSDDYRLDMERTELEAIVKALETTGNDRKAAARLLGISRSTLYLKLKKYGLI